MIITGSTLHQIKGTVNKNSREQSTIRQTAKQSTSNNKRTINKQESTIRQTTANIATLKQALKQQFKSKSYKSFRQTQEVVS